MGVPQELKTGGKGRNKRLCLHHRADSVSGIFDVIVGAEKDLLSPMRKGAAGAARARPGRWRTEARWPD